jgi:hypothetical protein
MMNILTTSPVHHSLKFGQNLKSNTNFIEKRTIRPKSNLLLNSRNATSKNFYTIQPQMKSQKQKNSRSGISPMTQRSTNLTLTPKDQNQANSNFHRNNVRMLGQSLDVSHANVFKKSGRNRSGNSISTRGFAKQRPKTSTVRSAPRIKGHVSAQRV